MESPRFLHIMVIALLADLTVMVMHGICKDLFPIPGGLAMEAPHMKIFI